MKHDAESEKAMNPSRRPLVAGNWKMNAGGGDGCTLAVTLAKAVRKQKLADAVDIVVAPPYTAIAAVVHDLKQAKSEISVAAQNVHPEPKGAFTGEVSTAMLKAAGAEWVIIGHSERRELFGETDDLVAQKLGAVLEAELRPIVCVGETLEQREAGQTLEVVERQVRVTLELLAQSPGVGAIAYEPVWAIGTGKVAQPEDAQQVHESIRALLSETAPELGDKTRILYGGSMKPDNAAGLLAQPDIDGGLVGGASLKADSFAGIIAAAKQLVEEDGKS